MKNDMVVFAGKGIRRVSGEKTEARSFFVADLVQALTDQPNFQKARKYWNKLKDRLKKEGGQPVTNCHRLKLAAEDGKQRLTEKHILPEGKGSELVTNCNRLLCSFFRFPDTGLCAESLQPQSTIL